MLNKIFDTFNWLQSSKTVTSDKVYLEQLLSRWKKDSWCFPHHHFPITLCTVFRDHILPPHFCSFHHFPCFYDTVPSELLINCHRVLFPNLSTQEFNVDLIYTYLLNVWAYLFNKFLRLLFTVFGLEVTMKKITKTLTVSCLSTPGPDNL